MEFRVSASQNFQSEIKVFDLGLVDYKKAWQFQKELFTHVKTGAFKSAIILCRHYPVITLGRLTDKRNILVPEYELKSKRIQICEVERGGDVTYHGPGQLMVYPVFNLELFRKDIHLFLRQLEEVVIELLSDFGINAIRYHGLTGVWVNPVKNLESYKEVNISNGINRQKIASVGIAIRNWITFHGLSINIKKDDLDNFHFIKPCGMDIEMTSLETVLGEDIEMDNLKENLINKFSKVFYNQEISLSGGGIWPR